MYNIKYAAGMAKLVYALDLESSEGIHAGSSPVTSTIIVNDSRYNKSIEIFLFFKGTSLPV